MQLSPEDQEYVTKHRLPQVADLMKDIARSTEASHFTRLYRRIYGPVGICQGRKCLRDYDKPVVAARRAIDARAAEFGLAYHSRRKEFLPNV